MMGNTREGEVKARLETNADEHVSKQPIRSHASTANILTEKKLQESILTISLTRVPQDSERRGTRKLSAASRGKTPAPLPTTTQSDSPPGAFRAVMLGMIAVRQSPLQCADQRLGTAKEDRRLRTTTCFTYPKQSASTCVRTLPRVVGLPAPTMTRHLVVSRMNWSCH
jgi:hypothetical protein